MSFGLKTTPTRFQADINMNSARAMDHRKIAYIENLIFLKNAGASAATHWRSCTPSALCEDDV